MSEQYQDGSMVASQVIAALQLAIERYGDLPVTYSDSEWSDSPVKFVSLEQEGAAPYSPYNKLPERILIGQSPPGGEIITRVLKVSEAL